MYPNPAQDVVSFSIPLGIEKATVLIFTSIGQQVLSSEISTNQNTIDISDINSGTYIISVESGGTKNSFKLIKK